MKKNFVYDPQRNGYDEGFWKTLTGTPSVSSNKIRLNSAGIVHYADVLRGTYNFAVTVPTTPIDAYLTGGSSATSQVAGILTGGTSATAVVGTWTAVSDGEFAITIDGTAYDITGIDFSSGVSDMDDVASKIQEAIRTATGASETVVWDTDHFIITAKVSVTVTSAVSGGSGTDISGVAATPFMDAETAVGVATTGWAAVTDGEFAITLDGTAYDITGIDFTDAGDIDGVATLIQTAIRTATGLRETVVWDTDHFVITSGITITVASAVSGGSGTDISGAGATAFLDADTGNGTVTDGTSKKFGLIQLNQDIYAMFYIYGDKLRCIVKDSNGNSDFTDVTWDDSSWTATETTFSIIWEGQGIKFEVEGDQVAVFDNYIVNEPMSLYAYNADADNLDFGFFEAMGMESYILSNNDVSLEVSDIEIGAVELKDATTDTRATIKADNAAAGTPNPVLVGGKYNSSDQSYDDGDAGVLQLNNKGQLKVTGGASSVSAEYLSPADFTATYASPTTITLSDLPIKITDSSQIVYIKYIPSGGSGAEIIVNGSNGATITVSSNVLTVNGAGTPFASGDVYEVGINGQRKAYDPSTQSLKESTLNPVYSRYTSVETLVSAQDLTASYADFGAEIDMQGYKTLGVWVIADVNDSTNVDLKALGKHTSAGTNEFEIDGVGVKTLWTTGASDFKKYYEFEVGAVPYVQLQAIAGTVGATAGDLTISITKIY